MKEKKDTVKAEDGERTGHDRKRELEGINEGGAKENGMIRKGTSYLGPTNESFRNKDRRE